MTIQKKEQLGEMLIEAGKLKESELQRALDEQKNTKQRLGEVLLKLGVVDEESVLKALSEQLGMRFVNVSELNIKPDVISLVPIKLAHRFKLIPLKKEQGILTVAMTNPFDVTTIDEIRVLTDCEVDVVISTETEILKAIKKYYGIGAETVDRMVEEKKAETVKPTPAAEKPSAFVGKKVIERQEDAAVIKFVNQLVNEAYKNGATDIHVEPFESKLRVRYRMDGVLSDANIPSISPELAPSIISRLKILADMNIAEKRLPQDGRIKVEIGKEHLDIRVSTIPTLFGESMNLRILPKTGVV
ncbi:MAG: ATPase, T2SS/T4P/T4SS family, partial [Elusimicrobiota bacterium]